MVSLSSHLGGLGLCGVFTRGVTLDLESRWEPQVHNVLQVSELESSVTKYASVEGLWHGSLKETQRDEAGAEEIN